MASEELLSRIDSSENDSELRDTKELEIALTGDIKHVLEEGVLPPPFSIKTRKEKLDGHLTLLKKYIEIEKFADYHIKIYDNWIKNILPNIINKKKIELAAGTIYLRFAEVVPPANNAQGEGVALTPSYARRYRLSYMLDVRVDILFQPKNDENVKNIGTKSIGKIPLMLGSQNCILHNKTDRELWNLREDPRDPLTYFIILGREKIILMRELLRYFQVQMIKGGIKRDVYIKITSVYDAGITTQNMLSFSKKQKRSDEEKMNKIKTEKLYYHIPRNGNVINVFYLFRYFYPDDDNFPESAIDLIASMMSEKWRKSAISQIYTTVESFYDEGGMENYYDVIAKSLSVDVEDNLDVEGAVDTFIAREFFLHLNEFKNSTRLKLLSLSSMTAKLCEYQGGFRKADNRDSWGFKQLLSPTNVIDYHFRDWLKKAMITWEGRFSLTAETISENKIMTTLPQSQIGTKFVKAFNTDSWTVGKKLKAKSVDLDRTTIVSPLSHVTRITVDGSVENIKNEIRAVMGTDFGYICPAETPDGENCGVTRNAAITMRLTVDQPYDNILELLQQKGLIYDENKGDLDKLDINGIIFGWCDGRETKKILRQEKLSRGWENINIILESKGYLYVCTYGSRLTRPLLTVGKSGKLRVDELKLRGAPFYRLIEEGAVEYVSAWEQEYIILARDITSLEFHELSLKNYQQKVTFLESQFNRLKSLNKTEDDHKIGIIESSLLKNTRILAKLKKKVYTHCELDPVAMFGISAALVPSPNRSQGPRVTYQSAMHKQTFNLYHLDHLNRFDGNTKVLAYPTKPLYASQIEKLVGTDERPLGQTVIVAFMTGFTGSEGMLQEDAIILNRGSLQRGLFRGIKYKTYRTIKKKEYKMERPKVQDKNKIKYLTPDGLPMINALLEEGDVMVGLTVQEKGETKDVSLKVGKGESGYVVGVKIYELSGKKTIQVKIKSPRSPEVGDKLAARYSQKATVSRIVPTVDMPRTRDGVVPDILINPHVIPSRMTMGFIQEIISGEAAILTGERVDATAFRPFDVDEIKRVLRDRGYNSSGMKKLYDGITGELIDCQIYMGPAFYQVLKHLSGEKVHTRSILGKVDAKTGQPVQGKKRGGGNRFGYMSKDAFAAHGAVNLLKSKTSTDCSEEQLIICRQCGIPITGGGFRSFKCRLCQKKAETDQEKRKAFGLAEIQQSSRLIGQYMGALGLKQEFVLEEK